MANNYPVGGTHRGWPIYAYLPYYPKRYSVPDTLDNCRQIVYDFKNGKTSRSIGQILADFTNDIIKKRDPVQSDWWLCIIPASAEWKTRKRFSSFCEAFCQGTGVCNGYDLIYNEQDRDPNHTAEVKVSVLDYIGFGDVQGKSILLFDDVLTTGRSFRAIANRLMELGAERVVGIFLGLTCHLDALSPHNAEYSTLNVYISTKLQQIKPDQNYGRDQTDYYLIL